MPRKRTKAPKYQIPHKLVRLRESRGLTQSQFAQLIGKSQAEVSRWESGQAPIPPLTWSRILIKCECAWEPLFHDADPPPDPRSRAYLYATTATACQHLIEVMQAIGTGENDVAELRMLEASIYATITHHSQLRE